MTGAARSRVAAYVALLLLAAAALVVIGTTIERNSTTSEVNEPANTVSAPTTPGASPEPAATRQEGETGNETGEGTAELPASATTEATPANETAASLPTETTTHAGEGGSESPTTEHASSSELGGSLETPLVITLMVIASVLLAGAVYWRPRRAVLVIVAAFTFAAAALDIAELIHQINEHRTGLMLLVIVILVLRAATLLGTVRLWRLAT